MAQQSLLRQSRLGDLVNAISRVRNKKARNMDIIRYYGRPALIRLFTVFVKEGFFPSTILRGLVPGYKEYKGKAAVKIHLSKFIGFLEEGGILRQYSLQTILLEDIAKFLAKPLYKMPLYLRCTVFKHIIARWRLKEGI